jgi:Arc/MetJ-type ribon-helix-helix transcriptional regulator
MEPPVTLRLDAKTRRQITRIAERRRISKSELIRQALSSWTELHEANCSPYEAMADLLGVVRGGNPKRSENGGRKFQKILKEKRRRS